MRLPARVALACAVLFTVAAASAQIQPLDETIVPTGVDSGPVVNDGGKRTVVFADVVQSPGAAWVRLDLFGTELSEAPAGGEATILRLTSLADGARQHHTATTLAQWNYTSAYFNGGQVLVELIADPGAMPSVVRSPHVTAGMTDGHVEVTICGPDDDRVLSEDPRCGRIEPIGCSSFIFNDANNCFLTAGHCIGGGSEIVEFNTPLSDSQGNRQHPGPEDQYAIDQTSIQSQNAGTGDDWGYFGCFPNTETGLTPVEAQGDFFIMPDVAPADVGQDIRITGYGSTDPPVSNTWNGAQKTHAGPYNGFEGTILNYTTDTTGGNSGSPVIDDSTGMAIGIHTHGGCGLGGGSNHGTVIHQANLQNALANPLGVCASPPLLAFEYPQGVPQYADPGGQIVHVVVTGANGGEPQPGSGVMYSRVGTDGPFTSTPMTEGFSNSYTATLPQAECGQMIDFYFEAQTTDGDSETGPDGAPGSLFRAVAAFDLDQAFADNFESDMGWTVESDVELSSGAWQRSEPFGDGTRGDPTVDADLSGQCFLTGAAGGNNDVDGGATTLISPMMDATQGDAHIAYWRWYSNAAGVSPFDDVFVIDISNDNGESWINLETVGPNPPDVEGGWVEKSFRIADFMEPTDAMRVRFIASDVSPASVVEAAVDGVRMNNSPTGFECSGCNADFSGDEVVDTVDLLVLLGAWGTLDGDLTGDGTTDTLDLLALLGDWGACP